MRQYQETHYSKAQAIIMQAMDLKTRIPFASKEAVRGSSMERFFQTNNNIKIDLSEFHSRFQLEEFFY